VMDGGNVNRSLFVAGVALVVTALVLVFAAVPVARSVFSGGVAEVQPEETMANLVAKNDGVMGTYEARFNGRSVFFEPRIERKPTRRVERPVERPVVVERDPEPAGPPRTYTGPSIKAMIGDEVLFHDGLRVRAGETGDGVHVISVDAPWSARVAYAGGEYDVSLFDRFDEEELFEPSLMRQRTGSALIPVEEDDEAEGSSVASADDGVDSAVVMEEGMAGDDVGAAGSGAATEKPKPAKTSERGPK